MAILQTSDFAGKYKVAQDPYNTVILQGYIDRYTPKYLAKLLGAELSTDMIDDIGEGDEPTDPDLLAIFEPFTVDNNTELIESDGIKQMLLGFIFFHFVVDAKVQANPISGTALAATENSTPTELIEAQVYDRYNGSVRTARAIQWKCQNTSGKYDNFNGQRFLFNSAF